MEKKNVVLTVRAQRTGSLLVLVKLNATSTVLLLLQPVALVGNLKQPISQVWIRKADCDAMRFHWRQREHILGKQELCLG